MIEAAEQRIRELERMLGRKQMAIEIFEAAQDEIKKNPTGTACRSAFAPHSSLGMRTPIEYRRMQEVQTV